MGVIWQHGAVEACWKCLKPWQLPFPAGSGEKLADRAGGGCGARCRSQRELTAALGKPPAPEIGIDMETNSWESCSGWEVHLEKSKRDLGVKLL